MKVSKKRKTQVRRMMDELDSALMRSASKKSAGKTDDAAEELARAKVAIFGALAASLPDLDPASAARELGSRKHIGVYAALLGEEADVAVRSGRVDEAHELYRRALDLQLESLVLYEDGAEQTRTAIRALKAKIQPEI